MIRDYLDSFVVGVNNNEPVDLMDIASNETEKIKRYIRNRLSTETYADATYYAPYRSLDGLQAYLKEEYKDYYVSLFETYGDNSHSSSYTVDKSDGAIQVYASDNIPYRNYDSWFIIISSVSYTDLLTSPSLLDSETLVAFGVNFLSTDGEGSDDDDDDDFVITIPPSDPKDYIASFTGDGGNIDLLDVIGDDSQLMSDLFTGTSMNSISNHMYTLRSPINGIVLDMKDEYKDYKIMVVRSIGTNEVSEMVDQILDYTPISLRAEPIPFDNANVPITLDSFLFLVSSVSFEQLASNPTLFETEFVGAFGITFQYDESGGEGIDELPPEIINPTDLNDTQFVRVLDGTTLEEYSIVPDVYNVKISQQINGAHTLSFNLLPYTNASNIYTPRIIEVDRDYYHVQQITKRHELNNLEMDIHCEHVSYELNYPPPQFFDDDEGKHVWTEDTYQGTVSEILEEMLAYNNRFTIGLVENNGIYKFKTSAEGFRTRINEFAEFVGLEVKWNKFTVALLRKRGRNNSLTLEVGKNIIGLTEVIDTVKLGKTKRSYELDVIDLNYVEDELENPIEAHNISLGDVITINDPQYRINRQDRVVGLTRDPFKKALPTIEFTNTMASYTSDGNSGTGGSAINLPIYQKGVERSATGNALGEITKATGTLSFATGYNTIARGEYSTSEGGFTVAHGISAHAEGYSSSAMGNYSHAEGYQTHALGDYTHSEGGYGYAYGNYSHVEGYGTETRGKYAHAEGINTKALGDGTHAEGGNTEATYLYAHAEGYGTKASGYVGHAEGYQTLASGLYSHSQGAYTEALGTGSHAEGYYSKAKGFYSRAEGTETLAEGDYSHAEGGFTKTTANYTHAQGYFTSAVNPTQMAMGRYNIEENQGSTWSYSQGHKALIIGNGSYGTRSNAFSVRFNGEVSTIGAYNTSGADYSEYFEWSDGNPNNEERKGYVTTFEGDKIRLANANDHYILGVVSSNPSIVGNAHEEQWQGLYLTDEWGNYEYHYIDEPHTEYDEEGKPFTTYRKQYVPVTNPNYDPNAEYIPRSERKEWDAIGMLGKLLVRDDGTCEINKYAKLSETVNGVLTNSADRSQFFVLRRINDSLVEVLIK